MIAEMKLDKSLFTDISAPSFYTIDTWVNNWSLFTSISGSPPLVREGRGVDRSLFMVISTQFFYVIDRWMDRSLFMVISTQFFYVIDRWVDRSLFSGIPNPFLLLKTGGLICLYFLTCELRLFPRGQVRVHGFVIFPATCVYERAASYSCMSLLF